MMHVSIHCRYARMVTVLTGAVTITAVVFSLVLYTVGTVNGNCIELNTEQEGQKQNAECRMQISQRNVCMLNIIIARRSFLLGTVPPRFWWYCTVSIILIVPFALLLTPQVRIKKKPPARSGISHIGTKTRR